MCAILISPADSLRSSFKTPLLPKDKDREPHRHTHAETSRAAPNESFCARASRRSGAELASKLRNEQTDRLSPPAGPVVANGASDKRQRARGATPTRSQLDKIWRCSQLKYIIAGASASRAPDWNLSSDCFWRLETRDWRRRRIYLSGRPRDAFARREPCVTLNPCLMLAQRPKRQFN